MAPTPKSRAVSGPRKYLPDRPVGAPSIRPRPKVLFDVKRSAWVGRGRASAVGAATTRTTAAIAAARTRPRDEIETAPGRKLRIVRILLQMAPALGAQDRN